MIQTIKKLVTKHPVAASAVLTTAATGAVVEARLMGKNVGPFAELADKVIGWLGLGKKVGRTTNTNQTSGTPGVDSTPVTGSTPTYKYTIDLSSLPARSQSTAAYKKTQYVSWLVAALNKVDGAGLSPTTPPGSTQLLVAIQRFQRAVGPAPGIKVDGKWGAESEDALLQIDPTLSRPPGYTGTR